MELTTLLDTLFLGLSYSAGLILLALGLAITFGVMGVINMAHGEMFMLGAYTSYVVTQGEGIPTLVTWVGSLFGQSWYLDWSYGLFFAIPVAFLVVALVGYVLEVTLIRHLYGRPLDTLLATWGVSLVLQQMVRLVFGAQGKVIPKPAFFEQPWQVAEGLKFDTYRVFIIGVTCLCLLGVYLCFFRTSFGLKVRAVTQNRPMASALGIPTRRVDALTFAFGAGLAGVAGCILGPYYGTKPDIGQRDLVDAFMVVILGGVGQTTGTVAGGGIIGTGNSLLATFLANEILSKVAILLLVIAFIQFRPAGLFAPRGRSYD